MRVRPPRVFDASALVDWFQGYPRLAEIVDRAEQGWLQVLMPTTAIVDAEAELGAGSNGWNAIFYTPGLRTLPLAEHTAVEIGTWPGTLSARHAVHEAAAVGGIVVTRRPGEYEGLSVPLLVV